MRANVVLRFQCRKSDAKSIKEVPQQLLMLHDGN